MMGRVNRYTPEQHAWIRRHYADMTNDELSAAFNAEFGTDRATQESMNNYGSQKRLRKSPETFARRNRKYTPEQLGWLRGFIPGHHEQEIIDAYELEFGERLTVSMVSNLKVKLGVVSGTDGGQFRRGQEPPNKGKTWDEFMPAESQERCRATQFRKGELTGIAAERVRDLLDVREGQDGYLQIKVAPRNRKHYMDNWMSLAKFERMLAMGESDGPIDPRIMTAHYVGMP